jgi:hypothetical protein
MIPSRSPGTHSSPITDLVKAGLFKNEKEALSSIVKDPAAAKVHYFNIKIIEIQSKYKMSFSEFKHRIEKRKDKEVFEEWYDFIIWESYESALSNWADVEAMLKERTA